MLVARYAELAVESGGHAEPGAGKAGRIMHVRGDNFVDTYRPHNTQIADIALSMFA